MALINIREVYSGVRLGLWKMDESVAQLVSDYPFLQKYSSYADKHLKSEIRKLEFFSVRVLLYEMLRRECGLGVQMAELAHNDAGKPLLEGFHVSISHTKGYVALILSRGREVAVDIEYMSHRVEKVASRFMRQDESAAGVVELLVHWCGKETVYKLFSEDNLDYMEMRVVSFDVLSTKTCRIENLKSSTSVMVNFEQTDDFILTYAVR